MKVQFAIVSVVMLLLALTAPGLRHAVLSGAGVETGPAAVAHAAVIPPGPSAEPASSDAVAAVSGERGEPAEPAAASAVRLALRALEAQVVERSHPAALRHAFNAYYAYRAANPQRVRKPYLYFVDFGLDARTPRGYVFDMDALRLVEGPFMVSHGRGSVLSGADLPTRFSNVRGSNATSLGLYLAQETYGFSGRSGGRSYTSVGLRLTGVSGRFNNAARARGIVVHGAPYVTATRAGRSEGCPAMTQELARALLPRLANGGMVFHFSPLDTAWLRDDPWVNAYPGRLALGE